MNFIHYREYVKSLNYWPLFMGLKCPQIGFELLTFDEWGVYV